MFGRRARRFGVGMEIPEGPLAYRSEQTAQPLSQEERALLIAAGVGMSGWHLGMPYTRSGDPEAGCNYPVRPIGRTYPSGAATHSSELLVTDDSGAYITRFRDLDPQALREYSEPDDLRPLAELLEEHVVRLADRRVELPAEVPHVNAHNAWVANQPGTTLFVPVLDSTQVVFNLLSILTGEGYLFVDQTGKPFGKPEALLEAGILDPELVLPLEYFESIAATGGAAELTTMAYNIQLVMQAMGLGGWLFSGINPFSLLGGFAEAGVPGFGFRFATPEQSAVPNPVGLDGLFETLVPPYVDDMYTAAERFAELKFGSGGAFAAERPGPYRDARAYNERVERFTPELVRYLGSIASDVYETYGRFPAAIPSVQTAVYTQAQHIDLGFYDRFYGEGAYLPSHAAHQENWHGQ